MTQRYGLVVIVIAVLGAILLTVLVSNFLTPVLAWLISVNVVAFLTYTYDKMIAGSQATRVPEKVLYLLVGLGGLVGAGLAMVIFHHKTRKTSFLVRFGIAALISIVLFGSIYFLTDNLF